MIRTLTLVACTGVLACSRSVSNAEPAAVDASALFAQACAKCHGADGRGGLAMTANGPRPIDLTSPEWHRARADQELVIAIRSGRGAMPPFGDVLTAEQIDALGAYVRRLKGP
jgi:cytochrome c oxidase cbb3-type subunit 3